MTLDKEEILPVVISIAIAAGRIIMDIYQTEFSIEFKVDQSPLTLADKTAHDLIKEKLEKTGLPVLSEEGQEIHYEERKNWTKFWMVDPLDGTKEFVKRNGEFTVNIALIENGKPIMGVIYAPVFDELYVGDISLGAFKISNALRILNKNSSNWKEASYSLPLKQKSDLYRIVASRSHLSIETEDFIELKKQEIKQIEIVGKGSSLKLCLIAEGSANVYPRFAPTMEWDTAAGHAIILAAGGKVVQAKNETKDLEYNKENLLNPWFIAQLKS